MCREKRKLEAILHKEEYINRVYLTILLKNSEKISVERVVKGLKIGLKS